MSSTLHDISAQVVCALEDRDHSIVVENEDKFVFYKLKHWGVARTKKTHSHVRYSHHQTTLICLALAFTHSAMLGGRPLKLKSADGQLSRNRSSRSLPA